MGSARVTAFLCRLGKYDSMVLEILLCIAAGTTLFGNGFRRAGGTTSGRLFRLVNRVEPVWGDGMTEKAVWHIVKEFAAKVRIDKLTKEHLYLNPAHSTLIERSRKPC